MNLTVNLRRLRSSKGQVLPLTVLMMFVLIGMAGLAIDVSSALSTQRFERAITDAAALAGAQDLQKPGTRVLPGPNERMNARNHAMDDLVRQLGGTKPGIDYSDASTSTCFQAPGCTLPGTPYVVSIYAGTRLGWPLPTCLDCTPELAVQLGVRNPSFGLTFSRILGANTWNVGATSVAGILHTRAYGLVTLRPPQPRNKCTNLTNCDKNDTTITVDSNVTTAMCNLQIDGGDISTNSNLVTTNNAKVCLDEASGFRVWYYDPYQNWTSPPTGTQTQDLVPDPMYPIPVRTPSTPVYTTEAGAKDTTGCTGAGSAQSKVPTTYTVGGVAVNALPAANVVCYKPGVYQITTTWGPSRNDTAYLFEPGVYWFDTGLKGGGTIIGGYEPNAPGVAFVFKESPNDCPFTGGCEFTANTGAGGASPLIALNYGSKYGDTTGQFAQAALNWSDTTSSFAGTAVQTTTTPPVLMSILVEHDMSGQCIVVDPEPTGCNETKNNTLNLNGSSNVYIAGVQYAPNDHAVVGGGSGTSGDIGQFISWTLKYSGGATLNLHAYSAEKAGVLRLDRACSPGEACNP